jgi:hypothetical protein
VQPGPDTRFVDSEEFLNLLVSWRKLERWDDSAGKVRGLVDRQSGMRFLIEQEKLVAL